MTNKMIFTALAASLLSLSTLTGKDNRTDLVQYANTLQGTDSKFEFSCGNTYPATGMPFGMHL